MTRMKHLFAALAIFASVGVTSFAATNPSPDQRASGQEAESYDEGGYSASDDPIWIRFFSGGGGGYGLESSGSTGWGESRRAACVRCKSYEPWEGEGSFCEAVVGGVGHARCHTENGTCKSEGVCWSR